MTIEGDRFFLRGSSEKVSMREGETMIMVLCGASGSYRPSQRTGQYQRAKPCNGMRFPLVVP